MKNTLLIGALALPLLLLLSARAGCQSSDTDGPSPLVWPPTPAEARIRYIESFSSPEDLGLKTSGFFRVVKDLIFGKEEERLVQPFDVAVDEEGAVVYVADPNAGAVHVFDRKKESYRRITKLKEYTLISPVGVAIDPSGRLFISDSGAGVVFVLDDRDKLLALLGPTEGLRRPTDLFFSEKMLFVVDTLGHRIIVYNHELEYSFSFGARGMANGQFNFPTNIAVTSDGRVYINDSLNFRIQRFDLAGGFVSSFGHAGDGNGAFNRPKGICTDSDGNIYVVDALFETVQVFDPAGRFLLNFGENGEREGEFWLPSGISIDSHDRIYVADSYNRRIQVFEYLKGSSKNE